MARFGHLPDFECLKPSLPGLHLSPTSLHALPVDVRLGHGVPAHCTVEQLRRDLVQVSCCSLHYLAAACCSFNTMTLVTRPLCMQSALT